MILQLFLLDTRFYKLPQNTLKIHALLGTITQDLHRFYIRKVTYSGKKPILMLLIYWTILSIHDSVRHNYHFCFKGFYNAYKKTIYCGICFYNTY